MASGGGFGGFKGGLSGAKLGESTSVPIVETTPEVSNKRQEVINEEKEDLIHVQNLLNKCGYDCGVADGIMGNKTRTMIENFQRDNGLAVTGQVSKELISALNQVFVDDKEEEKGIEGVETENDNSEYEMQINELKNTISELSEKNTELEEQIEALKKDKSKLNSEVLKLKNETQDDSGSSQQIDSLKAEKKELEWTVAELESTIASSITFEEYESLQNENRTLQIENTTLASEKDELKVNILNLEKEIDSLISENEELKKLSLGDEEPVEAMRTDNSMTSDEVMELLERINSLEEKYAQLEAGESVINEEQYGAVSGNVTYYYNDYKGNVADTGSHVVLIPKDGTALTAPDVESYMMWINSATYDNYSDYKIYGTKVDGMGTYNIQNVLTGEYYILIWSDKTTSERWYNNCEDYRKQISNGLEDGLSSGNAESFAEVIAFSKYTIDTISVRADQTTVFSHDFGITYN